MKSVICNLKIFLSVFICVHLWFLSSSPAALVITNGTALSISATNAWLTAVVVSTNGSTNAVTATLYSGLTGGGTNTWAKTNSYGTVSALGTISNNLTLLSPASQYYYRWYVTEGTNSDWADTTNSFWTLSQLAVSVPAVSNVTSAAATIYGTVTATNGITNAVNLNIFYGRYDYSNQATSWGYSNAVSIIATNLPQTFSTNITGLSGTTIYYCRWRAIEGTTTVWSTSSSNWTTLAGLPTNTPPANSNFPVMVIASGVIATPANFIAANTILQSGSAPTHHNTPDSSYGVVIGSSATSTIAGVAIGYQASAISEGTALGYKANGDGEGNIAIGGASGVAIATVDPGLTNGFTYTTEIGIGTATNNGWLHYRGKAVINASGQIPNQVIIGLGTAATNPASAFATAAQGISATNAEAQAFFTDGSRWGNNSRWGYAEPGAGYMTNYGYYGIMQLGYIQQGYMVISNLGTYGCMQMGFADNLAGTFGDARGFCMADGASEIGGAIQSGKSIYSGRMYMDGDYSGAMQLGVVNNAIATNLNGKGSLQLFNLTTGKSALMTGDGSLGLGGCIVTHDNAIVAGDGLISPAHGSISAGGGFFGTASGLTNIPGPQVTGTVSSAASLTYVTPPLSNSAAGSSGQFSVTNDLGTNFFFFYDANAGGAGTGRWVRIEGVSTW